MMSLDNTYSEQDVKDFVQRVQRLVPDERLEWVVEPKIDGIAVSLRYENGTFVKGGTRADGVNGDDVTANLRTIRTLPLRLFDPSERVKLSEQTEMFNFSPPEIPSEIEVRGEVFMKKRAFERLNRRRVDGFASYHRRDHPWIRLRRGRSCTIDSRNRRH